MLILSLVYLKDVNRCFVKLRIESEIMSAQRLDGVVSYQQTRVFADSGNDEKLIKVTLPWNDVVMILLIQNNIDQRSHHHK